MRVEEVVTTVLLRGCHTVPQKCFKWKRKSEAHTYAPQKLLYVCSLAKRRVRFVVGMEKLASNNSS